MIRTMISLTLILLGSNENIEDDNSGTLGYDDKAPWFWWTFGWGPGKTSEQSNFIKDIMRHS